MFWPFTGYDPFETIVELLVIGVCIFFALRFLQGTRGGGVIRGLIVLFIPLAMVIALANNSEHFERLNFFAEEFSTFVLLLLIVIFQPELRQAAIRVGQTGLIARLRKSPTVGGDTISAISAASSYLSRNQFGGLIAIERENSTSNHTVGGQELDAKISEQLLTSIFWPNNPLHDLGVVVRSDRIIRASSQFPLADELIKLPPDLGSRHRAAVGLSMKCDALIIIISEQTGRVSLADHGILTVVDRDDIEFELSSRLERKPEETQITDEIESSEELISSAEVTPESPK